MRCTTSYEEVDVAGYRARSDDRRVEGPLQRREADRECAAEDGRGRCAPSLRTAFENHLDETKEHVARLDRIFDEETAADAMLSHIVEADVRSAAPGMDEGASDNDDAGEDDAEAPAKKPALKPAVTTAQKARRSRPRHVVDSR